MSNLTTNLSAEDFDDLAAKMMVDAIALDPLKAARDIMKLTSHTIALEVKLAEAEKDTARLDWLEDETRCYWIDVQRQPDAEMVYAGQGKALRETLDILRDDRWKS